MAQVLKSGGGWQTKTKIYIYIYNMYRNIYIRYSIIFQDILFRFWPGLGLLDVDWQSHWQSLVVVPLSQIHWRSSEHSSIVATSWASGSRWEEVPMSMLRCWLMTRWLLLFHSYLHHCAPCIGETCKMLQIELFLHTKRIGEERFVQLCS